LFTIRPRLKFGIISAPILLLLFCLSARAQTTCTDPAHTVQACTAIPGGPLWCDQTFTITTAQTVQCGVGTIPGNAGSSGNKTRQFIQFQNNSATAANICVICFGAAAKGQTCSASTGGTYLGQGQAFSRYLQQYGSGIQINSLYFNSDISAVSLSGTCTLSVSIDG
jgi:hypothetical protein